MPWPRVTAPEPDLRAASQELMEELMGAVVSVDYVLRTLMDLPSGTLPGDDGPEAIRELLTASTARAVEAVGDDACRAATALIGAVVERMADDAEAAARLAEAADQRPC